MHDKAQDTTRYTGTRREDGSDNPVLPQVRVNVFGGFELLVDGDPVDYSGLRGRRLKVLLGILALNHGQELYSSYISESIWPSSPSTKQRNSFYNLWYSAMHAVVPEGMPKSAYFSREQYSCRMLDDNISTDVADAEDACDALSMPDITPEGTIRAYQQLQQSYRGDLLPGEFENPIIVRARLEWRERVAEALYSAAKAMACQGEVNTALWLVVAACRIDETREDLSNLRMRLLIDMGRPAAALRVYNDMHDNLVDELGVAPSGEAEKLVREVLDRDAVDLRIPSGVRRQRRRNASHTVQQRAFPRRVDLPV